MPFAKRCNSTAYAQDAGAAAGGGGGLLQLAPLVLIFVVFWFLLIRPQQKKMKAHKAMVEGLRRGDRVVTGGGMIGTVTKVIDEAEAQVELAEGVRVRVLRHTITDVLNKSEPAPSKSGEKSEAANDDGDKKKGGLFGGKKSD